MYHKRLQAAGSEQRAMPDLLALGDQLEDDLHVLARRTGLPRITLERAQAAWRAAGRAGLQALGPLRAVEPALESFHRDRIEDWLQRELPEHGLQVRARRGRFTVQVLGRERFQLRFVPDACRWLLFVRRGRAWWPDEPGRPCLSLADWLGQLRQVLTGARRGPPERPSAGSP